MACRRRPQPTILFTAITATVVLLPWAINGVPGTENPDQPATADETVLSQQPLTGIDAQETIREVSQATPFSMVALTSDDLTGTAARVRAKRDDGTWGPWYDAEPVVADGTDARPRGTEPVFVGHTTAVQIAISRSPATPEPGTEKPDLGYRPAAVEQPLPQDVTAVLIAPPQAPGDTGAVPTAVVAPGQPPNIMSRSQWGADESMRCGAPLLDNGVRAGVVHHTAGSNDYSAQDSAGIVRATYAYHTRLLGWCDIAYNALVDKYGQVFEGRAGGLTQPVEGAHTGGFNQNTWGVAMIGDFGVVPPTPIQLRTTARLLGWRLAMDRVDPRGAVTLMSGGSSLTRFPRGATPTLPAIFTHRDVGSTDCPGNAAYALMDQIRDIAARFNQPPSPADLAESMQGGAIHARWQQMGGMTSALGAPTSPESPGQGPTRYARFEHGVIYWSPASGANPVGGAIYDAWAGLGFEGGMLGLPTSAEIAEPEWIVQNFQHGTLNFDRQNATVTRVVDGVAERLAPPTNGPPTQVERFSPVT